MMKNINEVCVGNYYNSYLNIFFIKIKKKKQQEMLFRLPKKKLSVHKVLAVSRIQLEF